MAVFVWESGETFGADAPNQANSGGTGLIQIMPSTYKGLAKQMGLKNTEPTIEYVHNYWKNGKRLQRIKQLAQMSEIEQLDWIKQYFMPYKGKKLEFIDSYLQVLFPVSSGLPEHVVFASSLNKLDRTQERQDLKQQHVNAFAKNNMDKNGDGRVMKSEIEQSIEHYLTDDEKLQKIKQCSVNPVIVKPQQVLDCKKLNKRNEKKVVQLHPKIQCDVRNFINSAEKELGIQLIIVQGLRTFAEQDKLYSQGRTSPGKIVTKVKGGQSMHNYGVAIDVFPLHADGKLHMEKDRENIEMLKKVAPIAKRYGFSWGGDWKKFVDNPHFEKPFGKRISELRQLYNQAGGEIH